MSRRFAVVVLIVLFLAAAPGCGIKLNSAVPALPPGFATAPGAPAGVAAVVVQQVINGQANLPPPPPIP